MDRDISDLLSPIAHPDVRAKLPEIAIELKRMDGEHWAVGEMVERAYLHLNSLDTARVPTGK